MEKKSLPQLNNSFKARFSEVEKRTSSSARVFLVAAAAALACCAVLTLGLRVPQVEAQAGGPGRILSSMGASSGGLFEFNTDTSNVVNLTANTFSNGCAATHPGGYKDYHPSVSQGGGLIAFQSNRDGTGDRIFVMNSDGTNLRQVTFNPEPNQPDDVDSDFHPVISPDGSRIAFVSGRTVLDSAAGACSGSRVRDIYVVNIDGSNLRRVTTPQFDIRPDGLCGQVSYIISLDWNAEGTHLVFRGARRSTVNNVTAVRPFVVGTINADGSNETILAVHSTTGQSRAIDWSPNGRYIGYVWGGEAQGAPAPRVAIHDLQTGGVSEFLQGQNLHSNEGTIRFSPDSQRFVVNITTDFNSGAGVLAFLNIDGSGRTDTPNTHRFLSEPIWWQGGPAIPPAARLELIPNPVVVRTARPNTQLYPTLFDGSGNVIVRASNGWNTLCFNGSVRLTHTGAITPPLDPNTVYSDQVCASNGGIQTCVTLFVNPTTNKIDEAEFFVREHYADFLNREADASGRAFWTNEITSCGANAQCLEVKRINVSASFFLSIEFQQTGYLIERSYKTAYGDATGSSTFGGVHQLPVPIIRFNEFLTDTQQIIRGVVVLQPGWEQLLENNKQAFFMEFVQRARFTAALPTTMTPAQFVDKLNQNAGNVLSTSERTSAINLFGGAANTANATARAQAVRQVAEDQDLQTAEFNRAFVLMQYFGFLRRNPNDPPDSDYTGYDFWLTKLNQFNGNYINAEMVKAFLSSLEYRARFGP